MSARQWTCRFCGESGTELWLGMHACPQDAPIAPLTDAPATLTAADIEAFRAKVRYASARRGRGRGAVHLSEHLARRILAFLESTARATPAGGTEP